MSNVLRGKPVVEDLRDRLVRDIANIPVIPTLGIVRVGKRPDDLFYEKSIVKNCNRVGIKTTVYEFDTDISMDEFCSALNDIDNDDNIHGIMLFRPLPSQLDIEVIKHLISPQKDVDCINPDNIRRVFEGDVSGFPPCTPAAVVEILKYYDIELEGANAVIINSSMVVGKPLAMMLLKEDATITVCHIKTRNLEEIAQKADIVISAVGKARLFGEDYFGKDTLVVDVGINEDEAGSICGDIDYDNVSTKVKGITPVPGGVGTVTTSILLKHVVKACKLQTA